MVHIPNKPMVIPTREEMIEKSREVHTWAMDLISRLNRGKRNTAKSKLVFKETIPESRTDSEELERIKSELADGALIPVDVVYDLCNKHGVRLNFLSIQEYARRRYLKDGNG